MNSADGTGGHAARPHLTVNPLVVACSLGTALQTVVSRSIDPIETAVVMIGAIAAGEVASVIPQSARMLLSVRSFNGAVRDRLEARIRDLTEAHVRGYGANVTIGYVRGYPVIVNSLAEKRFAEAAIREVVGADGLSECPLLPGSEDFAYYLEHKPGAFLRLGNGVGSAPLHDRRYDFFDNSLAPGGCGFGAVGRALPAGLIVVFAHLRTMSLMRLQVYVAAERVNELTVKRLRKCL